MVQQNGIQETAYEEIKEITEYQFEYSTDRSWLDIVYNTAQDLVVSKTKHKHNNGYCRNKI